MLPQVRIAAAAVHGGEAGTDELVIAVAAVAEALEIATAVRSELFAAAASAEDAGGGGCGSVLEVGCAWLRSFGGTVD